MHAIPNHINSNFQIAYFLVGSCFTPDGAYALLCNLKESREMALAQVEANDLREKSKRLQAERLLASPDEVAQLEGKAMLAELNANKTFSERNITAAKDELSFIDLCIERIQPHRKYANLHDAEAHQAAQQEEWKFELLNRAEISLLTIGYIPTDQFDTMRMHPDYAEAIAPRIQTLIAMPPENRSAELGNKISPVVTLVLENKSDGVVP